MADLCNLSFTGCCVRDAQVKTINNKTLVEVSVASNVGVGQYEKTNWLNIKWWGDRAANAAPIFRKGCLVTGTGELSTNEYNDKSGEKHVELCVNVLGLQLLRKPKSAETKEALDTQEEAVF